MFLAQKIGEPEQIQHAPTFHPLNPIYTSKMSVDCKHVVLSTSKYFSKPSSCAIT